MMLIVAAEIHNIVLFSEAEASQWKRYCSGNIENTLPVSLTVLMNSSLESALAVRSVIFTSTKEVTYMSRFVGLSVCPSMSAIAVSKIVDKSSGNFSSCRLCDQLIRFGMISSGSKNFFLCL